MPLGGVRFQSKMAGSNSGVLWTQRNVGRKLRILNLGDGLIQPGFTGEDIGRGMDV